MWNEDRGYFYGVLLGDGFWEKSPKSGSPYVMLKTIDKDFVEYWRDSVQRITGKSYSVGLFTPRTENRNTLYYSKMYNRDLVTEAIEVTRDKTIIPYGVIDASLSVKKRFIEGAMDSEGYINARLDSLKPCTMQMTFAATDSWVSDLHKLFADVGVATTKIYQRKFKDDPRYKKIRKPLHYFMIDMVQYQDAGLRFHIKRKADRLSFCVKILRDFTRDYPRYADYLGR